MKRSVPILLSLLIVFCTSAKGDELGPFLGMATLKDGRPEYSLTFNFGIEQWEDEKLTTHRRQQWFLQCVYPEPVTDRPNTWCSLERVVIDEELTPGSGAMVGRHKHYSSEGTLRLLNADWQRGRLDFTIVYADKSTTELMLRMKFKDKVIYLDSFKATAIARGIFSDTMATIEYKIPKYTYMLNVPVQMRGLRSLEDKKWDDMFATLSRQDQHSWKKFQLENCKDVDGDAVLRKKLPNYQGGKLTPDEERIIMDLVIDQWGQVP